MKKKIVVISIIIVLIIIVALIATLILININKGEEKTVQNISESNQTETNQAENNQVEMSQTAEDTINEFYNNMKNQNFEAAAKLFDENAFVNYLGESNITEDLELFLKEAYNDSNEFYSYSIKSTEKIDDIGDFKNTTNIDITDEEYNEMFGNYLLYLGELNYDNARVVDVYILNDEYKMVSTVRLMSFHETIEATNDILSQAAESREETQKLEVKEELQLALHSISVEYMEQNDLSIDIIEYCSIQKIQEYLFNSTINSLEWNGNIGSGKITKDDTTYEYDFTLTQEGPTNVNVQ